MQATGFLPSRDGFSFRNDFDYPASRLGRAAPLAPGFGLAGGMCLAALDRWQAGRPLPVLPGVPAPGDVLYEELVRRQVELLSHGAWDRILEWQGRPGIGRFVGPRGVGELTRAEWSRLRRALERGTPTLLCVVRTRGPFANPSENPFVLAYRYEYARETKRCTIWVYDPNRPGNDDVRLTIVPGGRGRAPEVTFVAERVRGFMVVPYDRPAGTAFSAVELRDAESGRFAGHATPLPGRGLQVAIRAGNGGVTIVRDAKKGEPQRLQRAGAETVLASDPIVLPGALPTLVARAIDGTVVGLRVGVRGWRPRQLPSPKSPLQIDHGPTLVTQRGRAHVFGVQKGRLAHLLRSRAGSWTAAIVNAQHAPGGADALAGTPAACVGPDGAIRVFTRTEKGRIALHSLSKEGQWSGTLLPATEAPIAGDPIALVAPGDDQITVFAVTESGELMQTRGGGSDAWRVRNLTKETSHEGGVQPLRVEIAATDGPGNTLHVFGVSPRRGLVHYWCPPTLAWRSQDLTHGRAEVGDAGRVRGRPSVVRTADDQLVVAAAAEKGIVVYRWNAAADWTGDVLPLPPALADRASAEGPTLWRDGRGRTHLLAVLEDGGVLLGLPGRPESAHRAIAMQPIKAVQPARREMPLAGTAAAPEPVAPEPVEEIPISVGVARPIEAMPEPNVAADDLAMSATLTEPPMLPEAGVTTDLDEGFGAMDLPADEALVGSIGIAEGPGADSGVELLDLGGLAATDDVDVAEPASESPTLDIGFGALDLPTVEPGAMPASDDDAGDEADRDGWGSYGAGDETADLGDLGAHAFEPAAPLVIDPDSTLTHHDLPAEPLLPVATPARDDAVAAEAADLKRIEKEEKAAAAEAERQRIAAEKAEAEAAELRRRAEEEERRRQEEESKRVAAEKAAAEKAERKRREEEEKRRREEEKRHAAEKAAAEKAERKRRDEEEKHRREEEKRIAAEKAAAEKAERERIAAEKKAAEEAERQRIAAEKAAAEAAERERIAAEKAAAEEAERERIAAEKAAAEQAERERIAAEKAAAEAAERERIAAEKAAAEAAERERIAAEKAAAEEAERERIAAEKAAAEEAERKRAEEEKVAARIAAEQEAERREAERAAKKAEAERAKEQKKGRKAPLQKPAAPAAGADAGAAAGGGAKGAAKPGRPRTGRIIPTALEGLPLLDDEFEREPRPVEATAKPEEPKPKKEKPKLRSMDELIRLSDEHGPTFDKK